jgi:hypothetical protein
MTRYEGPVFDVQAHAVNPGALASTSAGITAAAHLAEGTKQIIIGDVLATAADDLNGERRLSALKGDNHQVVSINLFFPALAPDLLLGIAEQTNNWLAQRASENRRLHPARARAAMGGVQRGHQTRGHQNSHGPSGRENPRSVQKKKDLQPERTRVPTSAGSGHGPLGAGLDSGGDPGQPCGGRCQPRGIDLTSW